MSSRSPQKKTKSPKGNKGLWIFRRLNGLPWWLRLPIKVASVVIVLGGIALTAIYFIYGHIVKEFDLADLGKLPERSEVYDTRGKLMGMLHGENRTNIALDLVPKWFIDALISREDNRFRSHGGVDYIGVLRATYRNIKDGRYVQGAGTITMQLARNSYGLSEKTLHRKLVEAMLARRIEDNFSKDEILELYINRIFFGSGIYGLELASQTYFGKPATSMTLGESAMMAGIIRSPNRFSPIRNYAGACAERDDVLDRMVELGSITAKEAKVAKAVQIRVRGESALEQEDNYALDTVRRNLDQILAESDLEEGGLKIYTTIDSDLQQSVEANLQSTGSGIVRGAVIAINNRTGGILSIGQSSSEDLENKPLSSPRRVDGLIAPFVYATVYQNGTLPGSLIRQPNSSSVETETLNTVEAGLILSKDSVTNQIVENLGFQSVLSTISAADIIKEEPDSAPSSDLRTITSTLERLTKSYSIFPNAGIQRQLFIIDRIEDVNGNIIFKHEPIQAEVIPSGAANLVDRGLRQRLAVTGGEELESLTAGGIGKQIKEESSSTFIGYTGDITCGTWAQADVTNEFDQSSPAKRLWATTLIQSQQYGYRATLPAPVNMQEIELCRISGRRASRGCSRHGHSYIDRIPEALIPPRQCLLHDGPARRGAPKMLRP